MVDQMLDHQLGRRLMKQIEDNRKKWKWEIKCQSGKSC